MIKKSPEVNNPIFNQSGIKEYIRMSFEQNDKIKKRQLNMKKEILQHKLKDKLSA